MEEEEEEEARLEGEEVVREGPMEEAHSEEEEEVHAADLVADLAVPQETAVVRSEVVVVVPVVARLEVVAEDEVVVHSKQNFLIFLLFFTVGTNQKTCLQWEVRFLKLSDLQERWVP